MRFRVWITAAVASATVLTGVSLTPVQAASVDPAIVTTATVTSGPPPAQPPRRMVTGWLPYWNMSAAMSSVTSNAKVFTDVSPFWFSASGTAPSVHINSETSGIDVPSVVSKLHSLGIQVIPTVTDGTHWMQMSTQMSGSYNRGLIVSRLVNVVTANNFDGIDLDWEQFAFNDGSSTWSTTRPRWISFVHDLAAALHARGKLLSVTAPAGLQTQSDSTGYWVYAWGAIGPMVDRLRIMAYDYSLDSPGPIAPMYWVDPVVAHAVTQVDPAKIQIGVPSYGRDWLTSLTGTCPNEAPTGATSAQSASLFSKLDWASRRHEFDARYSASFISNLFVDAAATIPGISLPQRAVSTWDSTVKERTYTYQVGFSGRYQKPTVTASAIAGVTTGNAVNVSSSTGFSIGTHVTGAGIASGATVTAVRPNTLLLSTRNTGSVTGQITGTTSASVAATAAAKATALTVTSAAGITVGAVVSGTGIAAKSTVTAVSGTTVTLSLPTTAAVASNITFITTVTTTSVSGVKGTSTVVVNSVAGISVGATASGSGFASGATVTSISGHTVTLSKANIANVNGSVNFKPAPLSVTCTASRRGWYAEAQAANATASLVNKYHLGGIAEWTIGGEDTAQWSGITTFAKQIAAVPSVLTVTAPVKLAVGQAGHVSGSVTFKNSPLASAPISVELKAAGTQVWSTATTVRTDSSGNFSATIPSQPTSYAWRVTAVGDGWGRIDTPVTGATDVPSPLILTSTASRVALPGQVTAVSTLVQFHHSPVAGVVVTAAIQRVGTTTWTPVGQARTNTSGVAKISVPQQTVDFTWKLTVPGDGKLQLASATTGTVALASKAVATATAKLVVGSGMANVVSGTVRFRGSPTAAPVQLLVRSGASGNWLAAGATTSDAHGHFTATIPAQSSNYSWRIVVPTDGFTRLATSVDGATTVQIAVAAHVVTTTTVHGIPTIAVGAKPTFVGTATPRIAGVKVLLREYVNNVWTTVATGTTNAKGAFTLIGVAQVAGTVKYQVQAFPVTGQLNVRGNTGVITVTSK